MTKGFLAVLLAVAAGALSCAPKPLAAVSPAAVDRKLSTFAFLEEGRLVSFVVDTRSTREREGESFIPLEISVANRGIKDMTITRESFTLIDAEGNRYPCASPRELLEGYNPLDFDRRLAELEGILVNRYSAMTRYPSSFSPLRDASVRPGVSTLVRDAISLPQFGYFIDYIYFPKPKTGVLGKRFELFLNAPELPDPVFVKFVVQ
jgi:hypothetical protein